MSASSDGNRLHLGFLKVVTIEAAFVGGLLVTNRQGRPLEFQCTTPVRPNRTQEILYGPTLLTFISSELIGRTLVERLSVKPDLIVIVQETLLDLRLHIDIPVACIVAETPSGKSSQEPPPTDPARMQLGRQQVRFHPEFPAEPAQLEKRCSLVPADADLIEPLERVESALQETMRAGAVA